MMIRPPAAPRRARIPRQIRQAVRRRAGIIAASAGSIVDPQALVGTGSVQVQTALYEALLARPPQFTNDPIRIPCLCNRLDREGGGLGARQCRRRRTPRPIRREREAHHAGRGVDFSSGSMIIGRLSWPQLHGVTSESPGSSRTDVARSGATVTEEAGYAWMALNYSGVGEELRDSLPARSSKCMDEGSYELRSHWGSGGVVMPHLSVIHSSRRIAHSARG